MGMWLPNLLKRERSAAPQIPIQGELCSVRPGTDPDSLSITDAVVGKQVPFGPCFNRAGHELA